jgi:hypothetical protein
MILHSMQSAILDDKSSPRAYPRDEIAAQAGCAVRLNHVGFLAGISPTFQSKYHEMPAEETNSYDNSMICCKREREILDAFFAQSF